MRVPQEKREPRAVHFVSANKHPTVYHRYVGQLIQYFTNISNTHFFLILQISENMLNFWQGVYLTFSIPTGMFCMC